MIIPKIYGLVSLHRLRDQIARNPTLYSAQFVQANQAAIAVSLWCRALEAANKLQQDVGYASYGLPSFSASDYIQGSIRTRIYGSGPKQTNTVSASRATASGPKRSLSDDEVRLRVDDDRISIAARDGTDPTDTSSKGSVAMGGIRVRRDLDWSVEATPQMDR